MTATAIIAFLLGAALAQRFRIHILIPLLALAAFAACVVFATGATGWDFVLMAIVAGAALQIGYLAGAAFRTWELFTHEKAQDSSAAKKPKPNADSLPVH